MPDDTKPTNLPAAAAPVAEPPMLPGTMSPALAIMLDDKLFERAKLIAKYLSEAEGFVPPHLINKPQACFAVVTRSFTWKLDPYAVAQSTFQTPGGRVGYEGKLCQAILENSGKLEGPVRYVMFGTVVVKHSKNSRQQSFTSDDPKLDEALSEGGAVVVSEKDWSAVRGKFVIAKSDKGKDYAKPTWNRDDAKGLGVLVRAQVRGEPELRELRFWLEQAFPLNSTLWATDPETQIKYAAVRRFGSVAAPGLFMGVPFDREDLDPADRARDVTPPPRPRRSDFTGAGAASESPAAEGTAETTPEPFSLVTSEGQALEFQNAGLVCRAFEEGLAAAERMSVDAIDGLWESNALLLTQLRERGEDGHAAALHKTYTELVERRRKAEAEKNAPVKEAPSPLKDKRAQWPARVEYLRDRLRRMPAGERAEFLTNEPDFKFIEENRAADWQAIVEMLDELRG